MTQPPLRICSLLPSATEMVAALGLLDQVVAVSEECDFPPEARSKPVVTASRVDTARLGSLEIDAAVRSAVAEGRQLYAIDEEALRRLAPDVILTQDLCEVCAVSSGAVALCRVDAETMVLDAHSLEEIAGCVTRLGERFGAVARAAVVVADMQGRLARVDAAVGARLAGGVARPRVFVAEWLDPPFAAGHWVPEMVARAGGVEVLGRAGEPSFPTTWAAVRAARPDLVVLAPCGFGVERAVAEAEATVPDLGCRVVAVDANAYYSRPATRVAEGVEQLAHLLHPAAVTDPGLPFAVVRA
jgi:iron complex transport system substrate-binding protein